MPIAADIIRDSVNEFSRLQNWMLSVKAKNDMDTYIQCMTDILN